MNFLDVKNTLPEEEQQQFPFMEAPSFDEARDIAVERGVEKVRASCCLGSGWAFYGHDANGLAVVVEVYSDSVTKTTACPSTINLLWHSLKGGAPSRQQER